MKKNYWKPLSIVLGAALAFSGVVVAQDIFGYSTMRAVYMVNSYLDSSPVGLHSPSSGAFTNLSATSGITGNLTGNVIGNVTGNSSTASALAAAPTNCGSSNISYGIGANGNALCVFGTHGQFEAAQFSSGFCTTANTAFATCSSTMTWAAPFFDANYGVSCTPGPGQGSSAALTGAFISNITSTGFSLTLQNGGSGAAGAVSINLLSCVAIHQ